VNSKAPNVEYHQLMRPLALILLSAFSFACSSNGTPPPAPELPSFAFASLRGTAVSIAVSDQRGGDRDQEWEQRLDSDLRTALQNAGVQVSADATTRIELTVRRGRTDIENRNWKACVEISGRVVGPQTVETVGDACAVRANFWGNASAKKALRAAYEDALVRVLSALNAKL